MNTDTEKKFYTCRYDTAFKEVFMKEENKDILVALLESILDIKIKELTYLNLEKNVGNVFVKRKHFDLHVKTETENIQVEVNNQIKEYTRSRNASYICSTYSKEIEKYKYLIMLDLNEEELSKLSTKDRVVSKYMSEIEKINEDPSFWEFISAEEDNRKIENSLKKQYTNEGIEKGIKQTHIETAKLMKEKGLDDSLIKEITGIDFDSN